jgi:hypothetical protein
MKMDVNQAKKNGKRGKKNSQVSGPGLYKKILFVQMQPNIQQASKSVLFDFLVYSLLSLVTVWTRDKRDQTKPKGKGLLLMFIRVAYKSRGFYTKCY